MLKGAQHQNAPSLEEAGSQESWSLSNRENHRPARCLSHASRKIEDL